MIPAYRHQSNRVGHPRDLANPEKVHLVSRRSVSLVVLAAAAAVAVAAVPAGANPSPAHAAGGHGRFVPSVKGEALPTRNTTVSSLNWSGYATDPGSGITAVTSKFVVPKVQKPVPPGFSANWTGIGGYTSDDLIQAGTSENTTGAAGGKYYAWYEILPAAETQLTNCTGNSACTVTPGDKMSVNIHLVSANLWSVGLADAGHWTWHQNVAYTSTESSAEWIFEAPTVGAQTIPANTGTSYFGPTSTFADASGTHTIAAGNPITIDMGPSSQVHEATPSALASNGQSFNVCVYKQTCAAPSS
jgi:hypothetical protein